MANYSIFKRTDKDRLTISTFVKFFNFMPNNHVPGTDFLACKQKFQIKQKFQTIL